MMRYRHNDPALFHQTQKMSEHRGWYLSSQVLENGSAQR